MREDHQEHSFILRQWSDGEGLWRYSLEPLRGGARRYFASCLELAAYLQKREEACTPVLESQR